MSKFKAGTVGRLRNESLKETVLELTGLALIKHVANYLRLDNVFAQNESRD